MPEVRGQKRIWELGRTTGGVGSAVPGRTAYPGIGAATPGRTGEAWATIARENQRDDWTMDDGHRHRSTALATAYSDVCSHGVGPQGGLAGERPSWRIYSSNFSNQPIGVQNFYQL
jgi:hypothetical protein